jgi:hypothetical protein
MSFVFRIGGASSDIRAYQAEVARRARDGITDADPPSLLGATAIEMEASGFTGNYDSLFDQAGNDPEKTGELFHELAAEVARRAQTTSVKLHDLKGEVPSVSALPPSWGETLLAFLVSTDRLEEALGDLEQTFATLCSRRGKAHAKRVYYWHVVGIAVRSVTSGLLQAALTWFASK